MRMGVSVSRVFGNGSLDTTCCSETAADLNLLPLPALNNLARARLEVHDSSGALRYVHAAVHLAPHDPETLNVAGMVASAAGLEAEAEVLLKRALAADPMYADAHLNLCKLWGRVLQRFAPDTQRRRDLFRTLHWISRYKPDHSSASLLRENHYLRDHVLRRFRGCWQSANTRMLFHRPLDPVLRHIVENWVEILGCAGIRTRLLGRKDQTETVFEQFRPDVFITVAHPSQLARLDQGYIARYRRENRLLIGHITSFEHELPPCDFLIRTGAPGEHDRVSAISETPILSLPPGINPLRHYMHPGAEIWDYAFVGNNRPETIERLKACLLPIAHHNSGVLAGAGWEIGLAELTPREEPLLYSFSRISLNFAPSDSRKPNGADERTFVIPACGGFELLDNPEAIHGSFEEDELAVADSADSYLEMFDHYLHHPDQRIPIIRAGMRRVFGEHTLFHVMERLVGFLGLNGGEAPDAERPESPWESSESQPITWADRLI